LLGFVAHDQSIHYGSDKKGSYSKASNEERSGNLVPQAVQVTK
jgi:hypothetical protein